MFNYPTLKESALQSTHNKISILKYANQSYSNTMFSQYHMPPPSSSLSNYVSTPLVIKNKSCKMYFFVQGNKIYFNADFDSGNLQKVQQIAPYQFKLYPGLDKTRSSTQKTFFHFRVYGLKSCIANFIVTNVNILQKLITSNNSKNNGSVNNNGQGISKQKQKQKQRKLMISTIYHPVYRTSSQSNSEYLKVSSEVNIYYNNLQELQLSFTHEFFDQSWVQFAFSYPYTYQDNQKLIEQLRLKYENHEQIYFRDQILTLSKENKYVRLLTISDKFNCLNQTQSKINFTLLDEESLLNRPFKINKPVIFLTARVHPGESPASYCIEGALRFLLDQNDFRSYILRKNFLILAVPMLNPDGVFNGMFRSDIFGQNLNRVYLNCNQESHPTIFAVTKLAQWIKKQKQTLFYFDFHAHPSTKNFFIYGNSFNQISRQIQAQIFGKLIEVNCPYYQNLQSIYEQRQMSIKQKNQKYSKEGCARVYMHRLFDIVHSYTVECGYFAVKKVSSNFGQSIFQNQINEQNCYEPYQQTKDWQEIQKEKQYTPNCYRLMGKSILITILDIFSLNPYQKKLKGQKKQLQSLRKSYGLKIYHQIQKFRLLDANIYKKLSDLTKLIQQNYYTQKLYKFPAFVYNLFDMKDEEKTKQMFKKHFLPSYKQKQIIGNSINKIKRNLNSFSETNLTIKNNKKSKNQKKIEGNVVVKLSMYKAEDQKQIFFLQKRQSQKETERSNKFESLLKRRQSLKTLETSKQNKQYPSPKKISFKVSVCSSQGLKYSYVDVPSKSKQIFNGPKLNFIQNLMKRRDDLQKIQEQEEKVQQLLLKKINKNQSEGMYLDICTKDLNIFRNSALMEDNLLNLKKINLQYQKQRRISKFPSQSPISRKNSLNKIIYIKKDELKQKILKLSNLVSYKDVKLRDNSKPIQKNNKKQGSSKLIGQKSISYNEEFKQLKRQQPQSQNNLILEQCKGQDKIESIRQKQTRSQEILPEIKSSSEIFKSQNQKERKKFDFDQVYKKKFILNSTNKINDKQK